MVRLAVVITGILTFILTAYCTKYHIKIDESRYKWSNAFRKHIIFHCETENVLSSYGKFCECIAQDMENTGNFPSTYNKYTSDRSKFLEETRIRINRYNNSSRGKREELRCVVKSEQENR